MAKKKSPPAKKKAAEFEPFKLTGKVISFRVQPDHAPREYILVPEMPFGQARVSLDVKVFSGLATKDEGFQREVTESHRNKLKKAMMEQTFTPTVWAASVRQAHLDNATRENGHITFEVTPEHKLDHSDGNHRKQALCLIRKAYEEAKNEGDQAAMDWLDQIPISVQIFLDPEKLNMDFVNQQKGLQIKKAQLESMELKAGVYPPQLQKQKRLAHDIGILMFRNTKSFLHGQISFDSKVDATFSINVLSAHGASVMGSKLYGGAIIAHNENKKAKWMSDMYVTAYEAFHEYGEKETVEEVENEVSLPRLFTPGMVLCPPKHGGKKGGAEMLLGIGNMLAARCVLLGQDEASEDDLKLLVDCAEKVYDEPADGNLSDPRKRDFLQLFAREFFKDVIEEKELEEYQGIPQWLLDTFSYSTFQLKPPKKG